MGRKHVPELDDTTDGEPNPFTCAVCGKAKGRRDWDALRGAHRDCRRGVGRPSLGRSEAALLRFTPGTLERLDRLRGAMKRTDYLEAVLEALDSPDALEVLGRLRRSLGHR